MKLFIEYILDELEQIGLNHKYRVSLSSSKNEENYVRGVMQFFDQYFDIHFIIIFSYPEENPNLNYIFWILDQQGNKSLINGTEKKEKKTDIIKEKALKEIKINLTEGEDIRYLLEEINQIVEANL
ncbi:hypothetical protein [Heyndrickxia vini]|uniref:Uncharacterized protein n=1 Tax=Heyndrickxia vini TaxID=1476025 RepID=A0ABX7E1D3_9BACI|nr:hypothetical protein [Heyndrickxia vini]QQZ08167.1 hypothetical protein I5776_13905 [Heyndrickxia vini]